jgi:hypothetical protein
VVQEQSLRQSLPVNDGIEEVMVVVVVVVVVVNDNDERAETRLSHMSARLSPSLNKFNSAT